MLPTYGNADPDTGPVLFRKLSSKILNVGPASSSPPAAAEKKRKNVPGPFTLEQTQDMMANSGGESRHWMVWSFAGIAIVEVLHIPQFSSFSLPFLKSVRAAQAVWIIHVLSQSWSEPCGDPLQTFLLVWLLVRVAPPPLPTLSPLPAPVIGMRSPP